MSLQLPSERARGEIVETLRELSLAKQALDRGEVSDAANHLLRFRGSPTGKTVRQLQSDLLELRLTALRNPVQLGALATTLYARHAARHNEDAFVAGAADLIRRHRNPAIALDWLAETMNAGGQRAAGCARASALYLRLLRETGRLQEARVLAKKLLDAPPPTADAYFWEECLATLRGMGAAGRADLESRIESLGAELSLRERLRLWNIASASRIQLAALGDISVTQTDPAAVLRLALNAARLQATLNAREERYTLAAQYLQQARDLSFQLRGESRETLELGLEQFEMLIRAGAVSPTDSAFLAQLRSAAAQVDAAAFLEYRLANVWRRTGRLQLARNQYALVASRFPQNAYGVRANYQLAVTDQQAGTLDSAYDRYIAVASAPQTKPSVAMLCLVVAYRCAVSGNDEQRKTNLLRTMRNFSAQIPTVRQALLVVRQLRDAGLGELSDGVLDQSVSRYEALKNSKPMNPHKYLRLTHQLARRLYAAGRHQQLIDLVNTIPAKFWSNSEMQWVHLAGCLHYACLSWLALGRPDLAEQTVGAGADALNSRACQSAHVDLALARVYQQTRGWAWAQDVYNRIVARAPFSRAAMKARVQLAVRAWDTGKVDEARQWAMSALIDGKANRKDPDLIEAYWTANSMAASNPDAGVGKQ